VSVERSIIVGVWAGRCVKGNSTFVDCISDATTKCSRWLQDPHSSTPLSAVLPIY
jgi:hypothetical protein